MELSEYAEYCTLENPGEESCDLKKRISFIPSISMSISTLAELLATKGKEVSGILTKVIPGLTESPIIIICATKGDERNRKRATERNAMYFMVTVIVPPLFNNNFHVYCNLDI
jgi:hypothetical protein